MSNKFKPSEAGRASDSVRFKVGDKVRITGNSNKSCNQIGEIGQVTELSSSAVRVHVHGRANTGNWTFFSEMELSEPRKPLTLFQLQEGKLYRSPRLTGFFRVVGSNLEFRCKDGAWVGWDGQVNGFESGFTEITKEPLKVSTLDREVLKQDDGSVIAGCQHISKDDFEKIIKWYQDEV